MTKLKPLAENELPIGLFDSGVGGLSVLKKLKELLPYEDFVYLGDTARTPYGTRSQNTITQYSHECVNFLKTKDVKLIVVACNTASSVALSQLASSSSCPVIGMITPASEHAAKITLGRVGVIGTKATIRSEAYQTKLSRLRDDIQILAQACPLFVPLVEEGIFDGPIVDLVIDKYLSDMRNFKPDTLILGCTHYPLLKIPLERYFASDVTIIGCGEASANVVAKALDEGNLNNLYLRESQSKGKVSYFVTDEAARFKEIAKLFLGIESLDVSVVEV